MSEFCCSQGHLMKSGEHRCRICGGILSTMDGMTAAQLAAEAREESRNADQDEYDSEEEE